MRGDKNAAQQAYLNAKLNLDTEDLAFKKAQQTWQNTFDTKKQEFEQGISAAGVTGTYNGAPTLAAQAEQNKTFTAHSSDPLGRTTDRV